MISALSDAEKPAPSLYEAKCRAGIAPHRGTRSREGGRSEAHTSCSDSLFYGRPVPICWSGFCVGSEPMQPDFVDIATEVVKRLTERRGESCAMFSSKRLRAVPATRGSPLNRWEELYERYSERSRNQTSIGDTWAMRKAR